MKIKTNLVSGALFVTLGILLLLLMPGQIVVSDTTPFLESARVGPASAVIMMLTGGMILLFKSIVLKKEHIVTVYFSDQKHALFILICRDDLFYGIHHRRRRAYRRPVPILSYR